MDGCSTVVQKVGWMDGYLHWSPGGVRYRAPYSANKGSPTEYSVTSIWALPK